MDIILQIDEPFRAGLNAAALENAVKTTLQQVKVHPPGSVSIVVTNNQTVQQLNRQYRGIDAPTDVLSFENNIDPDFPEVDPAAGNHLGDIIIAYPVAGRQAEAAGHTAPEETILLTVHGLLHLLGFDHDTPGGKTEMWAVQQQILTSLGLGHIQPTES